MDNILILLAIIAAVVAVQANIGAKQSREIDKLSMLVDWRTKHAEDRLDIAEKRLKVAINDSGQRENRHISHINDLNRRLKDIEETVVGNDNILSRYMTETDNQIVKQGERLKALSDKITSSDSIQMPEVDQSKEMQLAEQWDNVINFNPLKDLEVARGN